MGETPGKSWGKVGNLIGKSWTSGKNDRKIMGIWWKSEIITGKLENTWKKTRKHDEKMMTRPYFLEQIGHQYGNIESSIVYFVDSWMVYGKKQ